MAENERPTDVLRSEHQELLAKLNELEHILDVLPESEGALDDLLGLSAFLDGRAWAHFWKEEDVLIPQLIAASPEAQCRIRVMLGEHEDLRHANERFQRAVNGYLEDTGGSGGISAIQQSGMRILVLLRNHLPAENEALFAEADERLSRALDRQILDAFDAVDKDLAWCCEQLDGYSPSFSRSSWGQAYG